MARNYSNISPRLALVGAINDSVTAITVDGDPVVSAPFAAVITPVGDKSTEEVVLVTNVVFDSPNYDLTVTRAYGGTSGKSHSDAAEFQHVVIAQDITEPDEAFMFATLM